MCLIDRWEQSGNGSGQRAEGDPFFGSILRDGDQQWLCPGSSLDDDIPEFQDGDNRASFLNGKGPHLLYLWELFDREDLLKRTLEVLLSDVGIDGGRSVSSTVQGRPQKEKTDDHELELRHTQRLLNETIAAFNNSRTQRAQPELMSSSSLFVRHNKTYIEYTQMINVCREQLRNARNNGDEDEIQELLEELASLKDMRKAIAKQIKKDTDDK